MKTVLEAIQAGTGYLERKGVENARLNMQHMVAHVLGCDRMQLYMDFDRPLGEEELAPLRDYLKRRAEGEPLQHLMGQVAFSGHDFGCDERALIPRPETEELVAMLIEERDQDAVPQRVLDMGAGSGVIGLSLASAWRGSLESVVLADISQEALELAKTNAEEIGVADLDGIGLEFVHSDLFAALSGRQFDLIVANLPYIARSELTSLSREVQRDPQMALDGGPDGTELMDRFIRDAPDYVVAGGGIAMEYGMGQGPVLKARLEQSGWQEVRLVSDFGGIGRFVFAIR